MVWIGGSLSVCDRVGISITMVIIPRRSLSVSGSIFLEAWVRNHCLELVVAASQDMHVRIGWAIRVCMEV